MSSDTATHLTEQQLQTLAYIGEIGGRIFRHDGGFWGARDLHPLASSKHIVFGSAIAALVKAGRIRYTRWIRIPNYGYPIAVEASLAPGGAP